MKKRRKKQRLFKTIFFTGMLVLPFISPQTAFAGETIGESSEITAGTVSDPSVNIGWKKDSSDSPDDLLIASGNTISSTITGKTNANGSNEYVIGAIGINFGGSGTNPLLISDNVNINATARTPAGIDGSFNIFDITVKGLQLDNGQSIKIGDNLHINIDSHDKLNFSDHLTPTGSADTIRLDGIYLSNGGNLDIGDNTIIEIKAAPAKNSADGYISPAFTINGIINAPLDTPDYVRANIKLGNNSKILIDIDASAISDPSNSTSTYIIAKGISLNDSSVWGRDGGDLELGENSLISIHSKVDYAPAVNSGNLTLDTGGIYVNSYNASNVYLNSGSKINISTDIGNNMMLWHNVDLYGILYANTNGMITLKDNCDINIAADVRAYAAGNTVYSYGIRSNADTTLHIGNNNKFSVISNLGNGTLQTAGIFSIAETYINDNNQIFVSAENNAANPLEALIFNVYGFNSNSSVNGIYGSVGKNFQATVKTDISSDTSSTKLFATGINLYSFYNPLEPNVNGISFDNGLNIDVSAKVKNNYDSGYYDPYNYHFSAIGLSVECGPVRLNDTNITVKADSNYLIDNAINNTIAHIASGIQAAGDLEISGKLNIDVSIGGGTKLVTAYGICTTDWYTNVNGPLSITANASGERARSYSLLATHHGVLKVNDINSRDIDVKLTGDVAVRPENFYNDMAITRGTPVGTAYIDLTLNTKESYLRGLLQTTQDMEYTPSPAAPEDAAYAERLVPGSLIGNKYIIFNLANQARWQPTGDNDVHIGDDVYFSLYEKGIVDLAWWYNRNGNLNSDNKFRTIELQGAFTDFHNGGGIIRVNSDIKSGLADKLSIDAANYDYFGNIALGRPAGEGKLYIQVGYDKSFDTGRTSDGSSYTLYAIEGKEPTVLEILNYTGKHGISVVTGQTSQLDTPLERYLVTPEIKHDITAGTLTSDYYKLAALHFNWISPSETVLVADDSQMALYNLWKIDNANLMRRLGELRYAGDNTAGIWFRTYNGKLKSRSAYGRSFNQNYNAIQVGWDKHHIQNNGDLFTGIMFNRIKSNAYYNNGEGKLDSLGIGLYATWLGDKGHYLDAVLRTSRLKNDYYLTNADNSRKQADYHTWAYGLSTEYGYRKQLSDDWFIEPQLQLDLGRIKGVNYRIDNGVGIKQGNINTVVTRAGLLFGRNIQSHEMKGNIYSRLSVLHEFGGDGDILAYYGNDSLNVIAGNKRNTWYEFNFGTNIDLGSNVNSYLEFAKAAGGSTRTDWQINAGVRWNW